MSIVRRTALPLAIALKNQIEGWGKILAFLDQYLGADAPAQPVPATEAAAPAAQ